MLIKTTPPPGMPANFNSYEMSMSQQVFFVIFWIFWSELRVNWIRLEYCQNLGFNEKSCKLRKTLKNFFSPEISRSFGNNYQNKSKLYFLIVFYPLEIFKKIIFLFFKNIFSEKKIFLIHFFKFLLFILLRFSKFWNWYLFFAAPLPTATPNGASIIRLLG